MRPSLYCYTRASSRRSAILWRTHFWRRESAFGCGYAAPRGRFATQCRSVFAEMAQLALVGQVRPGAKSCWPPYRRIRPPIVLRLSSNLRPICNRPIQPGYKPAAGYNPAPHPLARCPHPGKLSGIGFATCGQFSIGHDHPAWGRLSGCGGLPACPSERRQSSCA